MPKRLHGLAFTLDDTIVDNIISTADLSGHLVLLLTSALSAEGTTTVALALSRALSVRKKTILVDANLRDPEIHQRFNVSQSPGLVQIVNDSCSIDEAVRSIDGLNLIPAGEAGLYPLEVLTSQAMGHFVANAKQRYDFTIIDSPALTLSRDTVHLAPLVDGVILVVRAGKTPEQAVREAHDRLVKVRAKVLGVLFNRYQNFVPRIFQRLFQSPQTQLNLT
jgi:capsular exopolysaccharide synthesis family protein